MPLLPFGSAPTPTATSTTAGKVTVFQWGSGWNEMGLNETNLTIPTGQNIYFNQRLTIIPAFNRLTLNGRMIAIGF